ncbi:heterokaryon incompatibility protein-domain-containing protein, partial [Apodospora peruviana]
MWLLNTSTYSLEFVANPKDYAILSHTWEHEEVTFEDIKNLELAKTKAGWDKIEQTCRLAVDWNLQYAWVDTCCIDKSSSAELSEAINSMFQWYKQSTVCFVYLSDLESSPHDPISPEAEKHLGENLPGCRWFTRGWTLQELIAPYHVDFYDRNWTRIGTKTSAVMQTFLSKITKIDAGVLANPDVLPTMAVGRRMSWAAKRKTTRIEDIAYSLLGIFDVNMPMLYGEGTKAFIRLQEAIAEATGDLSLFAWSDHQSEHQHYQVFQGILARSPSQFSGCHRLENTENPFEAMSRSFTMVNRNIEFQTYLKTEAENGDYLMNLHCRDNDRPKEDTLVIRLLKTTAGYIR